MDLSQEALTHAIDYEVLLRKYMQLIVDVESVAYLTFADAGRFSGEELAALNAIACDTRGNKEDPPNWTPRMRADSP